MSGPTATLVLQRGTHRLVPAVHSEGGAGALARIADDDDHHRGILDLDHATDDRLRAESDRLTGIGTDELVFGVPHHRIINSAFSHAHQHGGRFNGPERGAWYAGFELETSQAEIAWHRSVEFAEIGWFQESLAYDDYLADFGGRYHDIREDAVHQRCLDPDSYIESQSLAETLLNGQSSGIIYPSVRHNGGTCLACFRPALVSNVRRGARYLFTWAGSREPEIRLAERHM